ncbi:MAG: hypothetical protein V4638_05500 [Bacteroidota bacterium]
MKNLLLLLSIVLFSLTSCEKLFYFPINLESEVTIPSTVGAFLPFSLTTPAITTNAVSTFEANNTAKEHVKSIVLNKLILTITDPSSEDFSFLNSINIFISANGLGEKKIAYISDIPATVGNEIECICVAEDLQEFVKNDQFILRVESTVDETLTQDIKINLDTRFLVKAKLKK